MRDNGTSKHAVALEGEARFGPFRLIPSRHLLLCDGKPVRIGEPARKVLTALVERAGEVVQRDDLIARAWRTPHLEESNLRSAIAALRRMFNEAGCARSYVDTVARRGYRFVEPVSFGDAVVARQDVPAPLAKIVGRDAFVKNLVDDIRRRRLVTVVGPGGIGKTVVALCAARLALPAGYIDSVILVALDTVVDAGCLMSVVRAGFGLAANNDDAIGDIKSFLGNRRVLIVLDGCERLVGPLAHLAEKILICAPNAVILATSREPLRAECELIRRLEPLLVPPLASTPGALDAISCASVELFLDRATSSCPSFELTDEITPFVIDICRRLDGIPLAIVTAAAHMDAFDLPVLADLMSGQFRLRMSGQVTALHRHRTLCDVLDWSFETLSAKEQMALRRLSVFDGVFCIAAAQQIVGDAGLSPDDVSGLLANLTAKSLVITPRSVAPSRHQLMETTRAYATGKLEASGEAECFMNRHASYYRARSERSRAALAEFHCDAGGRNEPGPDLARQLVRFAED